MTVSWGQPGAIPRVSPVSAVPVRCASAGCGSSRRALNGPVRRPVLPAVPVLHGPRPKSFRHMSSL